MQLCHQRLIFRQFSVGDHRVQNNCGALACCIKMTKRIVFFRSIDQSGKHRGFGQSQIGNALVEIELCGSRKSHRSGSEVHAVEIAGQNPVLRQAALEPDRDSRFLDFPLVGPLGTKEVCLHQLLGNRAAAGDNPAGRKILSHRSHNRSEIDRPAIKEAPVFDAHNRIDKVGRHILRRDRRQSQFSRMTPDMPVRRHEHYDPRRGDLGQRRKANGRQEP